MEPTELGRTEDHRGRGRKSFASAVLAATDRLFGYFGRYAYYRSQGYARRAARRKAGWHVR